MIKHLTVFTAQSIKFIMVDTEAKTVLRLTGINRDDIQRVEFFDSSKKVIIYFKNGSYLQDQDDYYDQLLNYFSPEIDWDNLT